MRMSGVGLGTPECVRWTALSRSERQDARQLYTEQPAPLVTDFLSSRKSSSRRRSDFLFRYRFALLP
jgi:hypothetical protein